MDVKGGMSVDALEHVHEADIWIDALEAVRRYETLHDPHIPRPHFRPAKQPRLAPHSDSANLLLQMIRIQRHVRIFQKHVECRLALQHIRSGFGEGIGGQQELLPERPVQPGKEGVHDQRGVLGAESEERLITTLKLKEVTASELFRRLNSYSKQHTLYRALKAFGRYHQVALPPPLP